MARPDDLPSAQRVAIEQGLERFSRYSGVFRLRLAEEEVARLNEETDGEHTLDVIDGTIEGETSASALLPIVSERTGGMDLVRSRSLVDACSPPERSVALMDGAAGEPTAPIPLSRTTLTAAPGDRVAIALRVESARGFPGAGVEVAFNVTEGGFTSPAVDRSSAEGRVDATSVYCEKWLEEGSPTVGRKTDYNTEAALRGRILPVFGGKRLKQLTTKEIREWLTSLLADGVKAPTVRPRCQMFLSADELKMLAKVTGDYEARSGFSGGPACVSVRQPR